MPQSNFLPGSGGNNAGYAVVYPDNDLQRMQIANSMHQANLAQQQRIEEQQRADAAHKYALNKYYGDQFDFDKFDTGTDLDTRINDYLIDAKNKVSDALAQKGISDEDVDKIANEALIPAMKLHVIGSNIKRNIDGTVSGYDKKDGIDTGSLAKQAYINALYAKDPTTGKLTLKSTDELNQIDPEHNYAADIVNNTPWLVSKGTPDIEGGLKKMVSQSVGDSGEYYDSNGVKHKGSWKTQIYPGLQTIAKDAKGISKVITVNNPIPVTDEKGDPVIDPKTGKQAVINQVPDDILNHFQQTPGQKAALDVATRAYLQAHPATANENAIPGTPGFEIAKKAMMYDILDGYTKRVNISKGERAPAFVIKNMLGIPGGGGSGSQTPAQQAADTSAGFNDVNTNDFRDDSGKIANIQNGQLVNPKGSFMGFTPKVSESGTVTGTMPIEAIPVSLRNAVVKYSQGNELSGLKSVDEDGHLTPTGRIKVQLTDGKLSGVMTDKNIWFNVDDRANGDIIEKNKNVPMKQKEQINLPNSGAGTTYQLGNKTITEDKLKKGAAKYKMTLDQYKKSIGL